MQVIKLEITVIDHDRIGADGVKDAIENTRYPNRCIAPHVRSVEVRDIGEWRDDHPLNSTKTADDELQRLFGDQRMNIKPLNWVERKDGVWMAVTPIKTTYAIQRGETTPEKPFYMISFNGVLIDGHMSVSERSAKVFCTRHHEKFVKQCFEVGNHDQ